MGLVGLEVFFRGLGFDGIERLLVPRVFLDVLGFKGF